MTEKKTREEYPNNYEWLRDNMRREMYTPDDESYPSNISFFLKRKQGCTLDLKRIKGTDGITQLKVQHVPDKVYEYSKTVGIKYCVDAIKAKLLTKSGKTRKSVESLPAYTLRELENLFHYIMQEYVTYSNRGNIDLTYQEWCLLFKPNK